MWRNSELLGLHKCRTPWTRLHRQQEESRDARTRLGPRRSKVLVLSRGMGTATYRHLTKGSSCTQWSPLPPQMWKQMEEGGHLRSGELTSHQFLSIRSTWGTLYQCTESISFPYSIANHFLNSCCTMPLLESICILDIPAEILASGLKAWKKWANQVSYYWRFLYNKQQELVAT